MNMEEKKLWRKIYKLRKAICALGLYALGITIALLIILCIKGKEKIDAEKYNSIPPASQTTYQESDKSNDDNTILLKNNLSKSFIVTAYCPCSKCCGKWANGITSTGTKAQSGKTIAVDPDVIPYGTQVIIDGHTYIAEDCGGAIKGNRIDVYFDTHQEALNFGRQTKEVTILN